MGTLSGGGKEMISIGEGCLIGANAGLGISLGDRCTVEAGLYLTAGTRVTLPDGSVVKARELSGRSDLLFRRNSLSGAVEALSETVDWGSLYSELHKKDLARISGFTPPPSTYARLNPLMEIAPGTPGGIVDLSVGTP